MARTLISGGTVVHPTGSIVSDVLIDGETIAALYAPGMAAATGVTAEKTIDATGKYVVPGGIDPHVHMNLPFGGTFSSDDFETGTAAAAWGGTTTIIDFGLQTTGTIVQDRLASRHEEAAGVAAIDYAFHMILGDVTDEALKAMDELVHNEGVTSFKLFMAYPGVFYSDDAQILRAMQSASNNGATIMMHAENGIAIDVLAAQAVERGETDPVHHGRVRRSALEGEATNRAIVLADVAGNVPLYFVHLSASEALAHVAAARDLGRNVFAETCPQYLYLTLEDQLGAPGFEGAKWVCSPPLRTKHEHHHADLWNGLRTNDLAIVSTDHCPFCFKDQKELGIGDFRAIPNGMAGVEHRMDLIYQGVADGKLTVERWVETCSTTPARMFGLFPRKGILAPGSDADVVVYDPRRRQTISHETAHMNVDHSSWEGFEVDGGVDIVLSRGAVVIENGTFTGRAGHGQFLKRETNGYLS
jgi:dihydropyrimidinase